MEVRERGVEQTEALLIAGSAEEVEIRACAVDAVEQIAARMRAALAETDAAVGARTTSGAAPTERSQSCCAHM